jgi:NAD(P)-dependent dehydrogenase (short-subunit alcohol dehydrogenase family)
MPGVAVVTGAGRGFGREIARRLARRGYTVLATDVDVAAAEATARELGASALALALDVRDPEAHRAAARAACERGALQVWVNNAGVLRTARAWEHSEHDVRLLCEVNLLGVLWGSRAAVEAAQAQAGPGMHLINIASLSAITPVPGLAVYSATKHAVLGFSRSLQGDLLAAGVPVTVHAVCPDVADTAMVSERAHEREAAILWSGPRHLSAEEVAERVVRLIDSRRLVEVIPRWRGLAARAITLGGRPALRLSEPLRKLGERRRARRT